ncbi:MAG: cobalamin biosynthesis protein CobW [Alphaproteobacteria bacterium]|jgi:cobalamin biosynthesis protein CobW|nr:cobalamin biosynthesis protein CobW [Alphaproteobacteria bacterium]
MATRIPTTVVTGFLGAGKTSLIRHLVENNNGKRLAFLINEFGDLGVDRELLLGCGIEGCDEDDVVELANGCICCTVADDFTPAMEALLDRETPPDHIIIETSGLALPKPLVAAFNWPEIRNRVTVDSVVTVVDAAAAAAGLFADDPEAVQAMREADPALDHDNPLEEVFTDQLVCADVIVLNKTDLLGDEALATLNTDIAAQARPGVTVLPSAHGRLDPAVLLGLELESEAEIDQRWSHHDDEGDHDHDDFESFSVDLGVVPDSSILEKRLIKLVAEHNILRIKGFLNRPDRDRREIIQGVGPRFQRYFDRDWGADEARQSQLVIIGKTGLDQRAITQALNATIMAHKP